MTKRKRARLLLRYVLLLTYVQILRGISSSLGLLQHITPKGSVVFHARGWIIERMFLAGAYANPNVAPRALGWIKQIRKSREKAPKS